MTAPDNSCAYNATSSASFVTITSGANGAGTGSLTYTVAANTSTGTRTATLTVGGNPVTITQGGIDQQSIALVTNSVSNNVSVIQLDTNTVVSTFAVGSDPRGVAVSADGTRAYIANSASGTVTVVNPLGPSVLTTITVGVQPTELVLSPDGKRLYVSNYGSNTVSVIDTGTNLLVNTLFVQANPEGIAISPDGGTLYVVCSGADSVNLVNTATGTVFDVIGVGILPFGIAITPDGKTGYVTNFTDGTVSVIDLVNNVVTATVSVGKQPAGVAVQPISRLVYVANSGSNSVSVINPVNNPVVAVIPVGLAPRALAVTADGSRVVVGNFQSNTASVIDTTSNTVIASPGVGIGPRAGVAVGPCTAVTGTGTSVGASGGTGSFFVASACPYFATSNSSFITITSGATGTSSGTVVFNVAANTGAARTGTITVNGLTYTVSQAAFVAVLTINPTSASIGASGGTGTIAVTSNSPTLAYTAVSSASFLTITSGASGTGSGTVTYSAAPNTDTNPRTATITINGQVFTLTQAGAACTYTLGAPSASFSATGGSGSVTLTAGSNCTFSVTSSASFVHVTSAASGSGSTTVTFTVDATTDSATRTGTITIGGQTFTITQTGVPCSYTLSGNTFSVGSGASSSSSVGVTTGSTCTYSASSNSSFLHVQTSSATGSGTIGFTIDVNTGAARVGTLTIAGQTVTVNQANGILSDTTLTTTSAVALYNSYSPYVLNLGNTTVQTRTITLTSGLGTSAYASAVTPTGSAPTFVTVSPASGTTPGTLTISANPAGLAAGTYTNTVNFTAGGGATSYTVTLTIQAPFANGSKVGVYRDTAGLILLDSNGDGSCCSGDLVGNIGQAGDIPLSGDWTGTGFKKFGLYRPSTGLFLLDVNGNGSFDAGTDKAFTLAAQAGDVPVVGDWTGTGVDRVGVFRPTTGTWYLDTSNDGSYVGRAFLGQAGDIPIVGNWNGGTTGAHVGIYRPNSVNGQPGNFFLVDSNGDGQYTSADQPLFFLGQAGDVPIVGDWNGDGRTKVGIFRPAGSANGAGLMVLDQNGNYAYDGPGTDKVLYFAPYLNGLGTSTSIQAGDLPVTGNWTPGYGAVNTVQVQGRTRTGIYRPSTGTFFLDSSADGTYQGRAYFGQAGDTPVGVPIINGGVVVGVNLLGSF